MLAQVPGAMGQGPGARGQGPGAWNLVSNSVGGN